MNRLTLIALILLAPSVALGGTAVCTIPNPANATIVALCEEYRITNGISSTAWTLDDCASEFLRYGIEIIYLRSTKAAATIVLNDTVRDASTLFNSVFAPDWTLAQCGDGNVDTEFEEECDDGNTEDGDGCSADCLNE